MTKEEKLAEKRKKQYEKGLKYLKKSRERQIKKQQEKEIDFGKKIKKFSDKKIFQHKQDEIFYKEIWKERPHKCINCGKFLGHDFYNKEGFPINLYRYAHIIPKSIYPYLRHYKGNIMLLCLECHSKFDNSSKEIQKTMKCYNSLRIDFLKKLHIFLKENNIEEFK